MPIRLLAAAVVAVAIPMVAMSLTPTAVPAAAPPTAAGTGSPTPAGTASPTPAGTAAGTGRQSPASPVTPTETVEAAGIVVHRSVATNVTAMVAAARAEGVTLTGSGYRSRAQQASLRISNGCPDVDVSPSSACRVPTARPGKSQHEAGLAIDFRNCSTRQTACFRWLSANAATYGFYNFPAEPWHWSTSGS